MKSITKYIIIAIIGLVAFPSCTDLDEELYSSVTTENYQYTEENVANIVTPIYHNLLGFHGNHFKNFCMQEINADAVVLPANASGWYGGGKWLRMSQHRWTSDQVHIKRHWSDLWYGVINANRIIEDINEKIIFETESQKQALLAEVKTARAYYYWQLMDNYGEVPIVTKVTEEYPTKKSRNEVYQFVVDELTASIPNLNESRGSEMYGRFNKWAGKALLANVYLNAEVYTGTAQWDKCLSQCNDIINSQFYEMEDVYDNIFGRDRMGSSEMIMGIQYDEIRAGQWNLHQASHHNGSRPKYQMEGIFFGAGAIKAVPQFIDTYDPDDLRLEDTWEMGLQLTPEGDTCRCSYENAGQPLIYTKDMKDGEYTSENAGYRLAKFDLYQGIAGKLTTTFPIFRYTGVLMMKAECLLRTGSAGEAATIVSNVRARAFEDPAKITVSASDLQANTRYNYGYVEDFQIVDPGNTDPIEYGGMYDELGWEFALESHRRRDAIRFGVYTKKSWLSHTPNGDYRALLPIPVEVVNSNPELEQNPNYN